MAWDFLSFGMGQMDGQAGVHHAETKAQLAQQQAAASERHADYNHNVALMFANQVKDMRAIAIERASRGWGHRAVRILLRDALIEVAPHHPLVNGESGRLLCKKAFDEGYREFHIDGDYAIPDSEL